MLIEKLQAQSGLSRSQLRQLSTTASKRYKVFTIRKRDGGAREIAQPSRALKAVQRWINKVIIYDLPVHRCATAYKRGANIRDNALRHAGTNFTLRMDFEDFFPSFSSNNVAEFFGEKNLEMGWDLSEEDLEFVVSITTRYGYLTIGAPSSPAITNAMMHEFDDRVFVLTRQKGLVYTRYADDLFISSQEPGKLTEIYKNIMLESTKFLYASLKINKSKTAYLSRRYRRTITGMVVTPQGTVSLGRERKREIKALIHKVVTGSLPKEKIGRARGLIGFSIGADPLFYQALCRKYSEETLRDILRTSA